MTISEPRSEPGTHRTSTGPSGRKLLRDRRYLGDHQSTMALIRRRRITYWGSGGIMVEGTEKWFTRFVTIWSGQAASLIGSQLVQFALVWYLTIQTGSATVLAIASVAAMLPQILLSPIAGAYVDRWKRRHVMIAADAFIATSTFVLIVLFALGYVQIWHIIRCACSSGHASAHSTGPPARQRPPCWSRRSI